MKTYPYPLVIFLISLMTACTDPQPASDNTATQPADASHFVNLASQKLFMDWEFDSAKIYMDKALEIEPYHSTTLGNYAWYYVLEENKDSALAKTTAAMKADPETAMWPLYHGWICMYYEDFECAETYVDQALALDSSLSDASFVKGMINLLQGNQEVGIKWMSKAAENPEQLTCKVLVHTVKGEMEEAKATIAKIESEEHVFQYLPMMGYYATSNDTANAMVWARKAYEARHPYFPWAGYMPPLKALRENKGFQQLVASLDLPKDPFD